MSKEVDLSHFEDDPDFVVAHAKKHAKQGDPDDVLRVIDEFCWKVRPLMNVGDVKGAILDKIFKECNPAVALELGSFLGYSTVRIARLLKPGGMLYAIEIDQHRAKLVREQVDFAGVGEKVTIINESTEKAIPSLRQKYGIKEIDFVFIDHEKTLYKQDLIKLLETGLLRNGTVVVADNVVHQSLAPVDYLKFVRNHPKFESELYESELEYTSGAKDGLEKSIFLG